MVKIYALHKVENAKETAMAAPGENLKINPDRLWDSLMEMAKIGPGVAGGNNRQTLTDEDAEGRADAAVAVGGYLLIRGDTGVR